MKARAVLLMFLISMISYTGFAYHTDPRQNSAVDDIVCVSADSIATSGVVSVDTDLQIINFSAIDLVASSNTDSQIDSIQFSQVTLPNYSITDIGKTTVNGTIKPYLFENAATIRAIYLYDTHWLKNSAILPKTPDIYNKSKRISSRYNTYCLNSKIAFRELRYALDKIFRRTDYIPRSIQF